VHPCPGATLSQEFSIAVSVIVCPLEIASLLRRARARGGGGGSRELCATPIYTEVGKAPPLAALLKVALSATRDSKLSVNV
jgi:hypothetical protein